MKRTPIKRRTPLTAKPRKRRKRSDLQKLKAKLWTLCREITRKRYGNTCYTCGKGDLSGGNWQTGHFISSSVCSTELRYDLKNLRPQCYSCNINKSGNWLAYENRLRTHHGQEYIDELKARNEATKGLMYREEWYEAKIEEYEQADQYILRTRRQSVFSPLPCAKCQEEIKLGEQYWYHRITPLCIKCHV